MLLRLSLIVAILAGIGVIVVSQLTLRNHITEIIAAREQNAKDRDQEKDRANKAESALKKTTGELTQTKTKLASAEKELASATTRLSDEQRRVAGLTKDLETVRAERTDAQQKLSRYELTGLQPEQIKTTLEELKKTLAQNSAIEEEKRILTRENRRLDAKIKDLLGPAEEEAGAPLPPGLKGKVAVVDPKWDFVVLDIGEKQGVLQNGIMMVSRNSKLVGKVKIVTVYPERSIANVMPGIWKVGDVQEGDQVLYLP
jgi:multidrug efflux pump subunit AcrA (membrane-fusion protein)